MSPLERWLWGTAGAVVAGGTAVCWWRLEKALKQERARHQAEMDEIDAEAAASKERLIVRVAKARSLGEHDHHAEDELLRLAVEDNRAALDRLRDS